VRHWLAQAAHDVLRKNLNGRATPGETGFAACALTADAQAARAARQFTRSTLTGWDLDPALDNVAIVVSELLTNALRYGLTDPQGLLAPPRPVWLGLLRRGVTVLCAVHDYSTSPPVLKEPDYLAQSGRGLHIIDSLSESWGWTTPNPAGKAVWAELSTPLPG
jgi:hypothetical protein